MRRISGPHPPPPAHKHNTTSTFEPTHHPPTRPSAPQSRSPTQPSSHAFPSHHPTTSPLTKENQFPAPRPEPPLHSSPNPVRPETPPQKPTPKARVPREPVLAAGAFRRRRPFAAWKHPPAGARWFCRLAWGLGLLDQTIPTQHPSPTTPALPPHRAHPKRDRPSPPPSHTTQTHQPPNPPPTQPNE